MSDMELQFEIVETFQGVVIYSNQNALKIGECDFHKENGSIWLTEQGSKLPDCVLRELTNYVRSIEGRRLAIPREAGEDSDL